MKNQQRKIIVLLAKVGKGKEKYIVEKTKQRKGRRNEKITPKFRICFWIASCLSDFVFPFLFFFCIIILFYFFLSVLSDNKSFSFFLECLPQNKKKYPFLVAISYKWLLSNQFRMKMHSPRLDEKSSYWGRWENVKVRTGETFDRDKSLYKTSCY